MYTCFSECKAADRDHKDFTHCQVKQCDTNGTRRLYRITFVPVTNFVVHTCMLTHLHTSQSRCFTTWNKLQTHDVWCDTNFNSIFNSIYDFSRFLCFSSLFFTCLPSTHPAIFLPIQNRCYPFRWYVDRSLHNTIGDVVLVERGSGLLWHMHTFRSTSYSCCRSAGAVHVAPPVGYTVTLPAHPLHNPRPLHHLCALNGSGRHRQSTGCLHRCAGCILRHLGHKLPCELEGHPYS